MSWFGEDHVHWKPSGEAILAMMRMDASKLENPKVEIRVFRSDDGFVYAYFEAGWVQGPREKMGSWR